MVVNGDRPANLFHEQLFRVSLASLPYLVYVSCFGLFVVLIHLLRRFKRLALDSFTGLSLLVVSGLMVLSAVFAYDRGEAFLQLSNFLPFFLWFGTLPFLLRTIHHMEQVAIALVIATIPINLISLGEYLLKAPWLPREIRRIPWIRWVRSAPHKGRAMVMFDHPNAMASYLVLILGLGLGLILRQAVMRRQQDNPQQDKPQQDKSQKIQTVQGEFAEPLDGVATPQETSADSQTDRGNRPGFLKLVERHQVALIYAGTFLNLLGLFCSGSRNGLLVAATQLVVFALLVKANRTVLISAVVGLSGFLAGALLLGIGGRSLSLAAWADDPRVGVWKIALDLIQERPWLGWGLGSYKLLYPPRLIDPEYPEIFHPHNFWLLLAVEVGIPVMILMTVLVGSICYRAVLKLLTLPIDRGDRAIVLGYGFAFWGCIAFALFDVTLYDVRINALNWALLAGLHAFSHRPIKV